MYDEKSNDSRESIQKRLTRPHWAQLDHIGGKWMVIGVSVSFLRGILLTLIEINLILKMIIFGLGLYIYYVIHFEPPRGSLKDDYRMT